MSWKNSVVLFKAGVLLTMLLALSLPMGNVYAHPVDMYAQNQSIVLSSTGLHVDWKITPGPLLADSVWAAADQNQDGLVSANEAQNWCAAVFPQWAIHLDGQLLQSASVEAIHWPAIIDA